MYFLVPQYVILSSLDKLHSRARPKSQIFSKFSFPRRILNYGYRTDIIIFTEWKQRNSRTHLRRFRSLWTILLEWRYFIPSAICAVHSQKVFFPILNSSCNLKSPDPVASLQELWSLLKKCFFCRLHCCFQ